MSLWALRNTCTKWPLHLVLFQHIYTARSTGARCSFQLRVADQSGPGIRAEIAADLRMIDRCQMFISIVPSSSIQWHLDQMTLQPCFISTKFVSLNVWDVLVNHNTYNTSSQPGSLSALYRQIGWPPQNHFKPKKITQTAHIQWGKKLRKLLRSTVSKVCMSNNQTLQV